MKHTLIWRARIIEGFRTESRDKERKEKGLKITGERCGLVKLGDIGFRNNCLLPGNMPGRGKGWFADLWGGGGGDNCELNALITVRGCGNIQEYYVLSDLFPVCHPHVCNVRECIRNSQRSPSIIDPWPCLGSDVYTLKYNHFSEFYFWSNFDQFHKPI